MKKVYENKYGRLELEIVGEYGHVRKFVSSVVGDDCLFSIEDAEKIALITENRNLQIAFRGMDLNQGYVLHHRTASEVALCRVAALEFKEGVDTAEALARPRPEYSFDWF